MTETKHTPGPWVWNEIAPDDREWGACEIWPVSNGDPDYAPVATMVCGVANARLIAAAPELLEAARFVLSNPPVEYDAGEWHEEGLKALGAALLCAEGRADE